MPRVAPVEFSRLPLHHATPNPDKDATGLSRGVLTLAATHATPALIKMPRAYPVEFSRSLLHHATPNPD